MMVLLELFISFLKIGFTSFGGLSMIPLITSEMTSHGWMTAAEVSDIVAIAVREQPEPGARQQPYAGTAAARLVATDEGALWHQTVQQLIAAEAITALVRELALQSQLVARDGDHWMLRVERESLNQPATRERLRTALANAGLGERLSVEVGVVTDSPARRNAAFAQERQRLAEETVRNDAFVQAMVRDFGAKIVPSGIKPHSHPQATRS